MQLNSFNIHGTMRTPLVDKTNSQLNIVSNRFNTKLTTRTGSETIIKPLADTHVTMNTPHNSPNIDVVSGSCFRIKPTSNYSNYREPLPRDIYLTPSESLDGNTEVLKESNKPKNTITNAQIKRLQLRMKLAYYKHTTNQSHLKFSDILIRQSKRPSNRKPSKSHRKLRKLAGSVPCTGQLPEELQKSKGIQDPDKASIDSCNYITPKKSALSRKQSSNSLGPSNTTPMSVRAAKSLLQLFSTSTR